MSQSITIHQIDDAVVDWIGREAQRFAVPPEMFARQLLLLGIELEQRRAKPRLRHDLDDLAGVWSEEEWAEFLEALGDFEQVDVQLWQ